MPEPTISSTYTEAMPDSSEQKKNLDIFMEGLRDMTEGNLDTATVPDLNTQEQSTGEDTQQQEAETQAEETQETAETQEQEVPEKIETPLGDIDSPIKKKDAPKVEAKVETPVAETDEEIGKQFPKKDKDARHEFIRMRKDIKAKELQIRELESLKAEVEELRTRKPEVKLEELPEYQSLQDELKRAREAVEAKEQALREANKVVAIANFKETPEYKQAVVDPWEKKLGPAIAEMAKEKGIDAPALFALVQSRDPATRKAKFNELVTGAELDTFDQNQLMGFIREYDGIMERHGALEQNAIQAQSLSAEERKRQQEEGYNQYKGVVTKALSDYRPKLEERWFPNLKNDPDLQNALQKSSAMVDAANWYEIPPEKHPVILETAMKAPILQMMYEAKYKADMEEKDKEIKGLSDKLKAAEDTVKKLTKASPSTGGGSSQRQADTSKIASADKFSIADSLAAI